jgi:hypothetical protein
MLAAGQRRTEPRTDAMSETGARPPLTVVRPGEGRLADPGSIGVAFKLWGPGTADTPARMIEIISPAGFECFFRDLADLLTAGSPSLADTPALAQSYGLEFGEPDWLPDVIALYGLDRLDGT